MVSTRLKLTNLFLFQIGWFACVLGAAYGYPWLGISAVLAVVFWHLSVCVQRGRELKLLLLVGLAGFVYESMQRSMGIVAYPGATGDGLTAPLWMAALWVNFATTLNLSLSWFKNHKLLGAACGLVAGPLAYYAGMQLGAISFPALGLAMLSIGLGWAALFPAALWLANSLNGFKRDDTIDIDWPKETYRV